MYLHVVICHRGDKVVGKFVFTYIKVIPRLQNVKTIQDKKIQSISSQFIIVAFLSPHSLTIDIGVSFTCPLYHDGSILVSGTPGVSLLRSVGGAKIMICGAVINRK